MKATANELSLIGQSISDDDLVLHTLAGLGDGYKELTAAIKVRESPMSFTELHEKVIVHDRGPRKNTTEPTIVTTNNVQRNEYSRSSYNHNAKGRPFYKPNNQSQHNNFQECRKLSRFLKDNDIAVVNPVAHATRFTPQASQQWLFDTGASHHVTPDITNLHQYSDYGGLDEVHIGNDTGTSNGSPPVTELVLTNFSSKNNKIMEIPTHILSPSPTPELNPPPDMTIHVQHPVPTITQQSNTSTNQSTSATDESTSTARSSPPQSLSPYLFSETSPTNSSTTPSTNDSDNRVTRVRKPNPKYFNSNINNNTVQRSHSLSSTKHHTLASLEPTCVRQAMQDSNWRDAMNTKYNALLQNGTWDLVPNTGSQNVVGCRWVFRIKRKPDGTVERYKARLVAKGFHPPPGIDFVETFSTIMKPTTIRIVLSLALSKAEMQWIQNLLLELGGSFAQPPTIHCDNIGATYLSANPVFHSRMKHLTLDYHFVRQQVQAGKLKVCYIST
ncbi:hypothetical protein AgCh_012014 [Apium graveolens]